MKKLLKANLLDLKQLCDTVFRRLNTQPGQEIIYRDLFVRMIGEAGIRDEFFPTRSAANYSLMYLLVRIVTELKPANAVELGAGQSTLLFDRLRKAGLGPQAVTTLEHDPEWIKIIRTKVDHTVHETPLCSKRAIGREIRGYDFGTAPLSAGIDLLVIDGPPAKSWAERSSRMGAIDLLPLLAKDGFIIIVDDAERAAESLLADEIAQSLKASGHAIRRGRVDALKRQDIIASGKLAEAAFF